VVEREGGRPFAPEGMEDSSLSTSSFVNGKQFETDENSANSGYFAICKCALAYERRLSIHSHRWGDSAFWLARQQPINGLAIAGSERLAGFIRRKLDSKAFWAWRQGWMILECYELDGFRSLITLNYKFVSIFVIENLN
jgi:hypothetical protein